MRLVPKKLAVVALAALAAAAVVALIPTADAASPQFKLRIYRHAAKLEGASCSNRARISQETDPRYAAMDRGFANGFKAARHDLGTYGFKLPPFQCPAPKAPATLVPFPFDAALRHDDKRSCQAITEANKHDIHSTQTAYWVGVAGAWDYTYDWQWDAYRKQKGHHAQPPAAC